MGGWGGDVAPVAIWMAADSELIISLYDKSVIIFCGAVTHFITSARDSQRNGEDSPSVRHIFFFFLFITPVMMTEVLTVMLKDKKSAKMSLMQQ